MGTKTLVTLEEYLATSFEHDREYVHGEVIERGTPTFSHGEIQLILGSIFRSYRVSQNLYASVETRVRISADLVRIPDLTVFEGHPSEFPSTPPLIAVEIASPDDRLHDILQKLEEYRTWGVRHIWLIEPQLKALYVYDGSLTPVPALEVSNYNIVIAAGDVFAV